MPVTVHTLSELLPELTGSEPPRVRSAHLLLPLGWSSDLEDCDFGRGASTRTPQRACSHTDGGAPPLDFQIP